MGDVSEPADQQQRSSTGGRWKPGQSGSPERVWKPGQSGNPAGRTPWRARFEEEFHKAAGEDAPALVKAIIEGAKLGDEKMLRILVDKLVRKPEHVDDATGDTRPTRLEVVFVKPSDAEE